MTQSNLKNLWVPSAPRAASAEIFLACRDDSGLHSSSENAYLEKPMNAMTKTPANKTGEPEAPLSVDYYKEICSNIRFTDDVSFKLLNIVPVLSGIGSTTLVFLEKSQLLTDYSSWAVVLLSLGGGLITFGLFKWELRNIDKCNWYIERAGDFERRLLNVDLKKGQTLQFADFDPSAVEKSPKKSWGKTEAEKLIYSVAIAVWLIPIIIVVLHNMETIGSQLRKNLPPM